MQPTLSLLSADFADDRCFRRLFRSGLGPTVPAARVKDWQREDHTSSTSGALGAKSGRKSERPSTHTERGWSSIAPGGGPKQFSGCRPNLCPRQADAAEGRGAFRDIFWRASAWPGRSLPELSSNSETNFRWSLRKPTLSGPNEGNAHQGCPDLGLGIAWSQRHLGLCRPK